jgi:predicted aconitase
MLSLNSRDQQMLSGELGETARLAMSVIVRMAEILEIDELIDITQAHIDACGLKSASGLEFIELLASHGGKVSVPTTLNMVPMDLENWQDQGIGEDYATFVKRMAAAYTNLGCIPTWTCAPYQGYLTPRFGQQIVWGESNAIAYANSVLGARTDRYADFMDICGAITGRVPKYGLHLTENRKGQVLFQLQGIPEALFRHPNFYPVLGTLVGTRTGKQIPVVNGVIGPVSNDSLKAFGAAAASSGAVGLFHMVSVTPEAQTLVIEVTSDLIQKTWQEMSTGELEGEKLDAVLLGCPHFSYVEFSELSNAIKSAGAKCHPEVDFLVMTNHASMALIKRTDIYETLIDFGGRIVLDSCVFHSPVLKDSIKVVMTNSGKASYYSPGILGVKVAFGELKNCVQAAVRGTISKEDYQWPLD